LANRSGEAGERGGWCPGQSPICLENGSARGAAALICTLRNGGQEPVVRFSFDLCIQSKPSFEREMRDAEIFTTLPAAFTPYNRVDSRRRDSLHLLNDFRLSVIGADLH
jgi:hypothetical protein